MDLYLVNDPEELNNMGLVDYPLEQTLWLVEWPERGGNTLPGADISITLEHAGQGRKAEVAGLSERGRWIVSNFV